MASTWGTSWGTSWGNSWGGAAVAVLQGTKPYPSRRRKGIYHPRTKPETIEEIREEKDETAELLVQAKAELQVAQLMAYSAVNRTAKIEKLELQVRQLEAHYLQMREEEEMMLMMLSLAMEM